MKNKVIAFSFFEGRVIRDWFENGLLQLLSRDYKLKFFTPAANVASFTSKWAGPGVEFLNLKPYAPDARSQLLLAMRRYLIRFSPVFLPTWSEIEKYFSREDPDITLQIDAERPDLVVVSNPMYSSEQPLFIAARKAGIPTLGVLRSWDNLYKGLNLRPDILAVWNPVNYQEAIDLLKYRPQQLKIVGANQFDPYFALDSIWSRQKFAEKIGLDPTNPIITIATLGNFQGNYDETYLVDWALNAIQSGQIPVSTQIICRLHPSSRLEDFLRYESCPNIRLSFIDGYVPSLTWTMTRDDVIFVGNLLRHSDVVISPGSTITIETAIFDTPTVVPLFHTYQPELGKMQFDHHLTRHFKRLKDLNLVPFVENGDGLALVVSRFLKDRSWYRSQRRQLVNDYVYYTDGKSNERLANLITDIVSGRV